MITVFAAVAARLFGQIPSPSDEPLTLFVYAVVAVTVPWLGLRQTRLEKASVAAALEAAEQRQEQADLLDAYRAELERVTSRADKREGDYDVLYARHRETEARLELVENHVRQLEAQVRALGETPIQRPPWRPTKRESSE